MEPITITLPSWSQIYIYFFPPESTDDVIIFPLNPSTRKFYRGIKSKKIIQGKASRDDINEVLTVFELVFGRVTSNLDFLMSFLISLVIPLLMTLDNYWFGWDLSETLKLLYLIFVLFAVPYCLYKRMRETGRRKADIQKMIEMIRPVYAKRGLTWNFSENLFYNWLELKKEGSPDEQNSTLSVEVHSSQNEESLILQHDSHCRIFEDFEDGENIIVCAGKNLTGPDFAPPVRLLYVISFLVYGYIMLLLIKDQYYYSRRRYDYYY